MVLTYIVPPPCTNKVRLTTSHQMGLRAFTVSPTQEAPKVANYCHYILSGSGCAWSAFAQFAIPAIKTKKYATDQRYAQSQDITMTALWFHGVSQNQFLAEYIWPLWDPALEIYEAI